MRYSRMLEESSFANKKADYFWLLLQSSIMLLVRFSTFHFFFLVLWCIYDLQCLSPLFNLPFLSSPLAFVPIYVWSRRHPSTPISLFGLITITAPYLPIALVAFSWVLNGTWKAAAGDLVGCAVGHLGWFMRDVWTREMVGGSSVLSEAPIRLWVCSIQLWEFVHEFAISGGNYLEIQYDYMFLCTIEDNDNFCHWMEQLVAEVS